MKMLIALLILTASTSAFAIKKSNYSTKIERYSAFNGAPWSSASNKVEVVQGPCENYGEVDSELQCFRAAKKDGFKYYQTTSRNHYKEYHGTLWDKTSYDYMGCFGCH